MGHLASKGVTWRRVALAKKTSWKKQKMRGAEGTLLEKRDNKKKKREGKREEGEKRDNWRKNGKNGRSGGQRRKGEKQREGKVGPQACSTIPQTSLGQFCLPCPVHLCTKKRPCSNRLQKKIQN